MKRWQLFLPVSCFLLALSSNSYSQITPEDQNRAIQEQNRLQKEQERLIEQQIKKQEKDDVLRKPTIIESQEIDEDFKDKTTDRCFDIKEIKLLNATLVSKRQKKKLLEPYINKCLGLSQINSIVRSITNFYIKNGYITSKVYVPKQNVKDGTLELHVVEGFVENIILNKKSNFRNKTQIFTAFGGLRKKNLNLRDIEQGIDQMNRLSSNNAKLNIKPGDSTGSSLIFIDNNPRDRTSLSAGYNNAGQKSTGEYMRNISLSQDNLLGLNDFLYLSHSKDNAGNRKGKLSESLYASLSIPFGYWTISANASNSDYITTISGSNQTFTASGSTDSYGVAVDRVFLRSKKMKLTFNSSLKTKDTESYLNDTIIDVGTRKLTILNLGTSNIFYSKYGVFYLKPSIAMGLDMLNAKKDDPNLPLGTQHAQFKAYKLYGFYNGRFNIPKTKIPLSFNSTLNSQFSSDELFSSESFSLGGQYTIRGFKEESVQSEGGAYVRNDLKISPIHLTKLGNSFIRDKILSKTTLSIFYDSGFARPKGGQKKFYMSGAGFGTSYSSKYFDFDFTYAKHLTKPNQVKDEGEVMYFSINGKVSF